MLYEVITIVIENAFEFFVSEFNTKPHADGNRRRRGRKRMTLHQIIGDMDVFIADKADEPGAEAECRRTGDHA